METFNIDTLQPDTVTPEGLRREMGRGILEALAAAGQPPVDIREGSFVDILLAEASLQIYEALTLIPNVLAAAVPTPESGRYLDKFGTIYSILRNEGRPASVGLTFTGSDGTRIPAGTVAVAETMSFATLEETVIQDGTGWATAEATAVGTRGNVAERAVDHLQIVTAGVTGVTNEAAATGGMDPETDAAFYDRIHTRLSQPIASGNPTNYKSWALEVAGVGFAHVIPLHAGAGTVKVLLATPHKTPPSEEVLQAAVAHIEEQRPIGASVTVEAIKPLPIRITGTVTLDPLAQPDAVLQAIEADIRAMLDDLPFGVAGTVRYKKLEALILGRASVLTCEGLQLNDATADVSFAVDQVPTLDTFGLRKG